GDEHDRERDQPLHPGRAADPGGSCVGRRAHALPRPAHGLLPRRHRTGATEAGGVTTASATAVSAPRRSLFTRARDWWANPWGKPRFLILATALYLVWSIVPILVAIRFSFNAGRSRSTSQGWSLRWYFSDPDLSVWHDPDLRSALFQSLRLAGI